MTNIDIKISTYRFYCPVCGILVKTGENYIDQEGIRTCLCILPVRKLMPIRIQGPVFDVKFKPAV